MRGGLRELGWLEATEEQRNVAAVHLEEATLKGAQLQGADLAGAQLQETNLWEAQLQGADLRRAELDHVTLDRVTFSDQRYGSAFFADINWGEVNLTVVDWRHVTRLGDEQLARRSKTDEGTVKDRGTRLGEYEMAVRANRQLALALLAQGMNEDGTRFAYHAQCLHQRGVLWFQMIGHGMKLRQRGQTLGAWLFSWFLEVFTGYGYKPERCFVVYVLAVVTFTILHYIVGAVAGPPLTWLNALAVSVQSLHGRIFSFQPSDPQTLLNTVEAFVGLFIEAIVVAVITQRILGK